MSNSDDGAVGCVLGAVAVVAAGWFISTKYEVKKKEEPLVAPAPPPAVVPALNLRPRGYVPITTTSKGVIWALDADSVKGARTKRQGWVHMDASKDKTTKWRTSETLYLADCETSGAQVLSVTEYDEKGNSLYSESTAPEKAELKYWPPTSNGGSVVKAICDQQFDDQR